MWPPTCTNGWPTRPRSGWGREARGGAHERGGILRQAAAPYPEGRWLFIPVESAQDAEDVQALVALRAREKRLG